MITRRSGFALCGAAAVLGVALLGSGAVAGAAAMSCQVYSAEAAADGVRVAFAGNNVLPLSNGTSAEGPSAAALSSSGVSSSSAGAPYPGSTALSAVSLVGGVVGGNGGPGFDSDSYPLAAQAQYPTRKHASFAPAPGLSLTADSAELSATAAAVAGGANAGGTGSSIGASTSTVGAGCSGDTGITSTADTDSEALNVSAGTLRIGRIHSAARSVIGVDGRVTLAGALQVGQVTVAGQTVQLSEQGLGAAGQSVPLPNPAGDVLAAQGITLRYLAAVKDPDGKGVTATGLVVSVVLPLDKAQVGTSPSVVTYTFGRAYARSTGGLTAGSDPGSIGGSEGTAAVPGRPAQPGVPAPDGGGMSFVPAPTVDQPAALTPDVATPLVAPSAAKAAVRRARTLAAQQAAFSTPATQWQSVYLVFILGGVALVGGGLVHRLLVERQQWI